MAWLDMVPLQHVTALLLKFFFPKWIQVLCQWLGNSPNYDEVSKWYSGWKSMFADALLSQPPIKDEFNKALTIMNRAASGQWVPNPRDYMPKPAPAAFPAQLVEEEQQAVQGARGHTAMSSMPASFKDLLQRKAAENNLIFVPIPNKTWEAKQVYKFGNAQIYLDRGVIFMYDNNLWAPTSLNTIIQRAR